VDEPSAPSEAAETAQDGTRERILETALDLFGEHGLTDTKVRDIASRAKVNLAAISYHFGGKEELYRAVAALVTSRVEAGVRRRAGLEGAAPQDPAEALAGLERLVETIVDVVVGPPAMRRVARFIVREMMQPSPAFEVIYGTLSGLHRVACALFGAASGREPESRETRLRVFLLIGQAIFLRIAEMAVLRRLEIDRYDDAFLSNVKAMLKQHVRLAVAAAREDSA
jgi:TetR/AcrR family transcriptional regulator, regulator of cefoperazone and chloramphenicol sensitivity